MLPYYETLYQMRISLLNNGQLRIDDRQCVGPNDIGIYLIAFQLER
jgi:hypothetical protein